MSRKEIEKELANIEDYVDAKIEGHKKFSTKSKERLITVASNSNVKQ